MRGNRTGLFQFRACPCPGTPPRLEWIARPEWVRREAIRSFGAQPLVFRREILGVLAVFSRARVDPRMFAWLRTFADHAAIAIAHARARAEIERLKEQLELENMYLRSDLRRVGPAGMIDP